MNGENLRFDGNAASDLLAKIFGSEMSNARATCTGCGARNAVGEAIINRRMTTLKKDISTH